MNHPNPLDSLTTPRDSKAHTHHISNPSAGLEYLSYPGGVLPGFGYDGLDTTSGRLRPDQVTQL